MLTPAIVEEAIAASIDNRSKQSKRIAMVSLGAGATLFLIGASPYVAAMAGVGFVASQWEYFAKLKDDREKLTGLLSGTATLNDLDNTQISILTQAVKATKALAPAPESFPMPPSPSPNHDHGTTSINTPSESHGASPNRRQHEQGNPVSTVRYTPPAAGGEDEAGNMDVPTGEGASPSGRGTHRPQSFDAAPMVAVDSTGANSDDVGGIAGAYGEVIAGVTDMDGAMSKPRHIALLAITQCGKTTTIGAISYALRERYPGMSFHALDAKNSNWPAFYESVCFPGYGLSFDAERAINAVRTVYIELERRVTGQLKGANLPPRLLLVLDEWNKTREDIAAKVDKTRLQELDAMVGGIVFQGLEFGVHLCMVLQEANCTKIGLTDSGRLNIHFLALARAGERSMVDALLENGMVLKSRVQCDRLRRDFERVWDDRTRPAQSPVIVDSRTYRAEALPDLTNKITLINHHENNRSDSATNPVSRGAASVPRSDSGIPSANPGSRTDNSDRPALHGGTTDIPRRHSHAYGATNANSQRNQNNGTANPTQQRPVIELPPDPWGDDGNTDVGNGGTNRGGDRSTGTAGGNPTRPLGGLGTGTPASVALPPDSEILSRFRSGWGICGLAVEYKVSNSSPEFEHLKVLEQQYKKEKENA